MIPVTFQVAFGLAAGVAAFCHHKPTLLIKKTRAAVRKCHDGIRGRWVGRPVATAAPAGAPPGMTRERRHRTAHSKGASPASEAEEHPVAIVAPAGAPPGKPRGRPANKVKTAAKHGASTAKPRGRPRKGQAQAAAQQVAGDGAVAQAAASAAQQVAGDGAVAQKKMSTVTLGYLRVADQKEIIICMWAQGDSLLSVDVGEIQWDKQLVWKSRVMCKSPPTQLFVISLNTLPAAGVASEHDADIVTKHISLDELVKAVANKNAGGLTVPVHMAVCLQEVAEELRKHDTR